MDPFPPAATVLLLTGILLLLLQKQAENDELLQPRAALEIGRKWPGQVRYQLRY
jgi:hypothetical protein